MVSEAPETSTPLPLESAAKEALDTAFELVKRTRVRARAAYDLLDAADDAASLKEARRSIKTASVAANEAFSALIDLHRHVGGCDQGARGAFQLRFSGNPDAGSGGTGGVAASKGVPRCSVGWPSSPPAPIA